MDAILEHLMHLLSCRAVVVRRRALEEGEPTLGICWRRWSNSDRRELRSVGRLVRRKVHGTGDVRLNLENYLLDFSYKDDRA